MATMLVHCKALPLNEYTLSICHEDASLNAHHIHAPDGHLGPPTFCHLHCEVQAAGHQKLVDKAKEQHPWFFGRMTERFSDESIGWGLGEQP